MKKSTSRSVLFQNEPARPLNSMLHILLSVLKTAEGPLSLEELSSKSEIDVKTNPALLNLLLKSDKIRELSPGVIEINGDLLGILHTMPKYHGLPVADVVRGATSTSSGKIDEWIQEIQDQEKGRSILHRISSHPTKKDPRLDILFYDWHPTYSIPIAIKNLWAETPIPANDDDLLKELEKVGIGKAHVTANPTTSQKRTSVPDPAKKTTRANRRIRLTNTHLESIGLDFSKDYEL